MYVHFDISANCIHVTDFLIFKFSFAFASLVCIPIRQDSTCHRQMPLTSNLLLFVNVSDESVT